MILEYLPVKERPKYPYHLEIVYGLRVEDAPVGFIANEKYGRATLCSNQPFLRLNDTDHVFIFLEKLYIVYRHREERERWCYFNEFTIWEITNDINNITPDIRNMLLWL